MVKDGGRMFKSNHNSFRDWESTILCDINYFSRSFLLIQSKFNIVHINYLGLVTNCLSYSQKTSVLFQPEI